MTNEIASIEEIVAEAASGRPYILVDAPDRENEGDVIIPAQFASAEQINFMARYARGLICLAIDSARARYLELPQMASRNGSGHGTAFTVSIEAREGVTTGISAHDRARTIAVAIDEAAEKDDLVSPGHVFPLVARDGGVLVRAGHTEAAVDISRMAGLAPAGVICEVMNDDGTMARLPELLAFGRRHGMKIGTIADLIAYRRRSETLVERVIERPFESDFGPDFRIVIYRNLIDHSEHIALVRGEVRGDVPTLVRVHQVDLAADLLGNRRSTDGSIADALHALAAHDGAAVAVFVQAANPTSLSDRIRTEKVGNARGMDQRSFGLGAQILRDLGIRKMTLMTSSVHKCDLLEGFGLHVVGTRPIRGNQSGCRPRIALVG